MSDFETLARDWSAAPLSPAWRDLVVDALAQLGAGDARGWQQLAMLFGDSGAPELCAIVALHALAAPGEHERALRSHANLALLDLGLAHAPTDLLPIAQLDRIIEPDGDPLAVWLSGFLGSVGTLSAGAAVCARVAAIRAELLPRPQPFDLIRVAALAL